MFSRLQSLVSQAVDVVTSAPIAKRDVDQFLQHWHYVRAIYEEQRRGFINFTRLNFVLNIQVLPRTVYATNIPFHLQQMIHYIQREELEQQQQVSDSSLTGPCLEALLQQRMLEAMVGWAEMDTPPGMRTVVLKTYAQLLSSLHHRLLPEGAIRMPLQRLIFFCHQLDVDGMAGESVEEMRLALVSLMDVVALQISENPALLNLFLLEIGAPNNNQSPSKNVDLKKAQWSFPLLMQLYDYITSSQENVATLARQAFLVCVDLLCRDLPKIQVPQAKMGVILAQRLIILFSMMPPVWPPKANSVAVSPTLKQKKSASKSAQALASPVDSAAGDTDLLTTEQTGQEKSISDFLDFWSFTLEVLERIEEGSRALRKNMDLLDPTDGPLSTPRDFLDDQVMRVLNTSFLEGFLQDQMMPGKKLLEFLDSGSKDLPKNDESELSSELEEWQTKLYYLTLMLAVLADNESSSVSKWTEHLFHFVFQSSGLGRVFGICIQHPVEVISITAWKIVDALLATYHPSIYRHLILSHLTADDSSSENTSGSAQDESFQSNELLIEELLAMAASMDPLWSSTNRTGSPDPSQAQPNSADAFLTDVDAARRYDAYFIEAQDRHPQIVRRYVPWSKLMANPASPTLIREAIMNATTLQQFNLIRFLEEKWAHYWSLSPRQLLQLTRFVARLAHLPDPPVHRWLFASSGASQSKDGWFPLLRSVYKESIAKWKTMPDVDARWRAMQIVAKDDVVSLFQEWNSALRSVPSSPMKNETSSESEVEKNQTPCSLFLPAYLILAECMKELAAIIVVVERTMALMDTIVLSPVE